MSDPLIHILIILGMILLNGFFAGSEIAIISLRKARVKMLLEQGDPRAKTVQGLQSSPERFFATVQVGITVLGTLMSMYGAEQYADELAPVLAGWLAPVPLLADYSLQISLGILVVIFSYLMLVLGDLAPKSLGHRYAEKFALAAAGPLLAFSRVFQVFIRISTWSANIVLWPFKDRTSFSETKLLPEEILQLLEEGVKTGSIAHSEHEIIENVLEFKDTVAREVMIPRVDMKAVDVESSPEDAAVSLLDQFHSRLPVFSDNLDHIVGILHIKDLMKARARGDRYTLSTLARPAFFVPETMKIGDILKEMQKRKTHMAIVVDEYGGTSGLLTMEDILEEIVGEIEEVTEQSAQGIESLPDGSYLVPGGCSIPDFNEYFDAMLEESDAYTSVAGYLIHKAGRFPEVGETMTAESMQFELVRRVRQKLVQFRVTRVEPAPTAVDESKT